MIYVDSMFTRIEPGLTLSLVGNEFFADASGQKISAFRIQMRKQSHLNKLSLQVNTCMKPGLNPPRYEALLSIRMNLLLRFSFLKMEAAARTIKRTITTSSRHR
jgi:hypothetical protein